ncbi:hypothetical protein LTR10_020189 [Elasticomyces elasticus]|uniref:White collar 1 protein n=1 Tax=Exophiala sideris TaxID=1016849 RepID=A0ABR0JCE4_9EURO|nr:hypothetical protein LTR10_020189 [Elasticomyces elasticus]KAK5031357.1 hypothetical protein LTS07_005092 [Exophiala sideris]KAK5039077.1 hypothetical protein LTR13_004108 [Exophiala sideris]KAK5060962.1 hypothetical protein LTR69_005561 [Exophiala sideris]KAK5183873.1 hypothetical protein LTR44_004155 [Eurotiomycetes sp. CCFEE 6388]
MDGMHGFYGQGYPGMDPHASMDGYAQDDGMNNTIAPGSMDTTGLSQAQTLHQIISQNNEALMRQRNTFQPDYHQGTPGTQDRSRRASMLEFGVPVNGGDLANFQFDPNPNEADMTMSDAVSNMIPMQKTMNPRRVRSKEDLALNTRFSQMNTNFGMSGVESFGPGIMGSTSVGVEPSSAFMDMSMDFDPMAAIPNPTTQINDSMFSDSPIDQNFTMSYQPSAHDAGGGSLNTPMNNSMAAMAPTLHNMHQPYQNPSHQMSRQTSIPASISMATGPASAVASPAHVHNSTSRRQSGEMQTPLSGNGNRTPDSRAMNPPGLPHMPQVQGPQPQPQPSKFANAYSSSGFDMLGVLMRVATRPNPEINIGPVDLSCAFVVCDLDKFDLPIVYCSEMFERLTGYTKHEILGRNCRFLQAPDGKVQSGIKRKYVDDNSVLYLKNQIARRQEGQLSLINYRKGGQPFMNLLTMIPIQFDSEDYKFYVGFQVDLVEQPGSVSRRNPDGSYEINYNRSSLPAYTLPAAPDPSQGLHDLSQGQTVPRDEVSKVLTTIGRGDTELSKQLWDKILLENTDDVVHVLSLKGLFLYLSPACRRILEYDARELVGTALSTVCHPSDIVPVTRELKDSSNGSPVNVVYRIRRKFSGYTWFEAHGGLHTEQGKGKKCIILVGRERPVYALDRNDLSSEGGTGESELWSKISTAGMFLHVSSTSRVMLDRLPEDLMGTSLQSLMRPDSRKEFARMLEMARSGEKVAFRHDLQNRRGQVLHAQTTMYPGDARPGSKPTFLLAQTRLLKMTRAALLSQKSTSQSPRTDQASIGSATPATNASGRSGTLRHDSSTSLSSDNPDGPVTQAGSHGLVVGNQDEALASEDNVFDELKTTRSSSWQFELRQMERQNRILSEELQGLLSRKKKRKRRKGLGQLEKDCANCHTRVTPEWRRGPSGNRDLCNSCGLRWAKQNGRVSPRKSSSHGDRGSTSPAQVPQGQSGDIKTTDGSAAANTSGPLTALQGVQPKQDDSMWRGPMPPKIEEGDEPPHPNVLPS